MNTNARINDDRIGSRVFGKSDRGGTQVEGTLTLFEARW